MKSAHHRSLGAAPCDSGVPRARSRGVPVAVRELPRNIGYAGAVALAAFYIPGPFAGWLFGKLVETAGWSTASLLVVVGPPLLGVVLMSLYDFSKMRKE